MLESEKLAPIVEVLPPVVRNTIESTMYEEWDITSLESDAQGGGQHATPVGKESQAANKAFGGSKRNKKKYVRKIARGPRKSTTKK